MTPRAAAVKALLRQEQDGYANLVLDAVLKQCTPPLAGRDAAFAARIFYTVVERLHLLDYMLAPFLKKPIQKLDAPVRAILRSGLAQACFMQVPLPAAVNESVKLTRTFGKASAAGMVNAVLRRAAAVSVKAEGFADPLERLTIYYSLSQPVAQLLLDQYGPQEAEAMAKAFYTPQPTWIRANPLQTDDTALASALQKEGTSVQNGPWPHCLQVAFAGSPAATKPFARGAYHVQGLPSQYAALCLAPHPGQRVADLCAAPGGKSLTLAELMHDEGELYSGEAVQSRVSLLQRAFARCGIHCAHALHADATQYHEEWGSFDRVLCDVPCSGLGTIGKKPDVRYKTLDGIQELLNIQQKILQNGARYLAQNGRLVYSTCTVNRAENEEQVRTFLQHNPDFTTLAPQQAFPGTQQTDYGTLFLPQHTGTDGFFVSILQRRR